MVFSFGYHSAATSRPSVTCTVERARLQGPHDRSSTSPGRQYGSFPERGTWMRVCLAVVTLWRAAYCAVLTPRPAVRLVVLGTLAALVLTGSQLLAAEPVALLGAVSGTVAVVHSDGSAVQPASPNTPLGPGDRIATVGRSLAVLRIPGIGEVEFGADTTSIVLDLTVADGVPARVVLEVVQGATIHRLSPASGRSVDYRVVDPSGLAVAQVLDASDGVVFGVGRDENGAVTVACERCSSETVTFPGAGQHLGNGRTRSLTPRGDVVDGRLRGSPFDALARGATAGDGDSSTSSAARLPPGQRTRSRDGRRRPDGDGDHENTVARAATPTDLPAPMASLTPTATTTPSATPTTRPTTVNATIAFFVYLPDPIRIPVGGTVTWTNLDRAQHSVTSDDLSWSSPILSQSDRFSHTFSQRGTFRYFCEPHPQMTGYVEVD
ncbi:MAG: cupredoxin family copper-binding protein [Chloroflexi bacterium]|nr:cupredoxin family copper-binding protein [Chloroflexota bacterium]